MGVDSGVFGVDAGLGVVHGGMPAFDVIDEGIMDRRLGHRGLGFRFAGREAEGGHYAEEKDLTFHFHESIKQKFL